MPRSLLGAATERLRKIRVPFVQLLVDKTFPGCRSNMLGLNNRGLLLMREKKAHVSTSELLHVSVERGHLCGDESPYRHQRDVAWSRKI